MTKSKKDKLASTKKKCLIENQKQIAKEIKLLTAQSPAKIREMMLLATSSDVISAKTISRKQIEIDDSDALIRIRYFELPVKKSTFQADSLKLVALFNKKSKQFLTEKISDNLSENLIQKLLIKMRQDSKVALGSVHFTNHFFDVDSDTWDIDGELIKVTQSQSKIEPIRKTTKTGEYEEYFKNAEERDEFFNLLNKSVKRFNIGGAKALATVRKKYEPLEQDVSGRNLKQTQEFYDCPAEALTIIISGLAEMGHTKAAQYLDTVAFNTSVARINFDDMNVLSLELIEKFDSKTSEDFLDAVEYAHLKVTPMSKIWDYVEKAEGKTSQELGLEQFRSS
jgi:hypothetical protein